MEAIYLILSIIGAAATLLITLITFTIKLVKAIKAKNKAAAVNLLTQGVTTAVQFAEKLKSVNDSPLAGETKKNIALNEVKAFCAEHNIGFNEETVSDMIEEFVALTKTINAPKSSTELTIKGAEIK